MFVVLVWNKLPIWLVFIGTITVAMTLQLTSPAALLKGYSNTGVVTVAALYPVAAGMYATGAISLLSERVIGLPRSITMAQLRIFVPISMVSSFLFHPDQKTRGFSRAANRSRSRRHSDHNRDGSPGGHWTHEHAQRGTVGGDGDVAEWMFDDRPSMAERRLANDRRSWCGNWVGVSHYRDWSSPRNCKPIRYHWWSKSDDSVVQKPGGYVFADFAKVGFPLTIIVGVVVLLLAPIVYGF